MTEGFSGLPDRRNVDLCSYTAAALLWAGVLMFVMRLGARRQIPFRLGREEVRARLEGLCGQKGLPAVPHGDTVADFLRTLPPEALQGVVVGMGRALLEGRRLEKFRLLDAYYLVAVDLSGHLYLGDRASAFTEGRLTHETEDGRTLYYRPVCEAKLVTRTGLALSVGSEFVENVPRNGAGEERPKHDCELRAGARLFPRLKRDLGNFPVCVLLDSLWCNETGFSLCEANGWRFLIVLKEGSLPTVMGEFEALRPQCPDHHLNATIPGLREEYTWVNDIAYGSRSLHVLECVESVGGGPPTRFVWVSNIEITREFCQELAEGGRQRWRIENEGFHTQKHAGFEMEHAYAREPIAGKNFYLLLQIAHILSQMFEVYCLGKRAVKREFGSLRNLAHALLEAFRRDALPDPDALGAFLEEAIQIRMDTS